MKRTWNVYVKLLKGGEDMDSEEVKAGEAQTAPNNDVGVQPKAPKLIEDANAAAERIEKALEGFKSENDRRERLVAENRLGGETLQGAPTSPETQAKQRAVEFWAGTGIDKSIEKYG